MGSTHDPQKLYFSSLSREQGTMSTARQLGCKIASPDETRISLRSEFGKFYDAKNFRSPAGQGSLTSSRFNQSWADALPSTKFDTEIPSNRNGSLTSLSRARR
jgi:hypothetical protein